MSPISDGELEEQVIEKSRNDRGSMDDIPSEELSTKYIQKSMSIPDRMTFIRNSGVYVQSLSSLVDNLVGPTLQMLVDREQYNQSLAASILDTSLLLATSSLLALEASNSSAQGLEVEITVFAKERESATENLPGVDPAVDFVLVYTMPVLFLEERIGLPSFDFGIEEDDAKTVDGKFAVESELATIGGRESFTADAKSMDANPDGSEKDAGEDVEIGSEGGGEGTYG
ncbi:hypothetical protein BGX26_002633 [Mortierella sp. AD094]|nr:hypothetical protein BGX26_002633 [Mortierella sp. AD094]